MIERSHGNYQRPTLPTDDELVPDYKPPPPPTPFESVCLCIHSNHRLYTVVMFGLCVAILLWGGLKGFNVRSMSNSSGV